MATLRDMLKRRKRRPPDADDAVDQPARREPAYHQGQTILPETSHRVSSAADVDANVRRYGSAGVPRGGAGGYGGAGTR